MDKKPEELFKERAKRVEDAIQLKVPDRVPLVITLGYFPAKYGGITCEDAFYDHNRWRKALKATILGLEPDMYLGASVISGRVFEALECRQIRWPGHGVPATHTHQFVEGEYMKSDEYDAFLKDPSDYAVRTYMPRIYGALGPLEALPPLRSMLFGYGQAALTAEIARPEFASALQSLSRAGYEALKWRSGLGSFDEEMARLGFPSGRGASAHAPFDIISDHLRGMRGTMLDMYRHPDKLLEACETLLPMMIERAISGVKRSGNPRVFMPLHRGSEGFMSLKQFETFYWPTLKRLIWALADEGLTPCPHFEGDYTSRLEYLLELPRGKVEGQFDQTDMVRAKQVLGNHLCIRGNVPSSILQVSTPQEVRDYCKRLIDVVGKGGGFIMSPGSSIDEAKPENIKAMCDFTRENGVYS